MSSIATGPGGKRTGRQSVGLQIALPRPVRPVVAPEQSTFSANGAAKGMIFQIGKQPPPDPTFSLPAL
jgi:hypothetical protein